MNSTEQMEKAIQEVIKELIDNETFKRWLTAILFGLTYDQPAAG